MALGPRLELRVGQQLVLTPQLQQAIQLLAMTNIELEAWLQTEIEKNPLLDVDSDGVDGPAAASERDQAAGGDRDGGEGGDEAAAADPGFDEPEPATADQLIEAGDGLADAPLDADVSDSFPDADRDGGPGGGEQSLEGAEVGDIDALADAAPTLRAHLEMQALETFSGANLAIARHLIDLIDDAGYLRADLEEVAAALGAPRWRVEAVHQRLMSFDPTGVGARTLAECLMLQAAERGWLDEPMGRLLRNLEAMARGDMVVLRRVTGLKGDALRDLLGRVRALDPKPGTRFARVDNPPVIPDIFVRRNGAGWVVELNTQTLPRVLVNRRYHAELSTGAIGGARHFLSECMASASWLTRALDQRARTITVVATELVRQQQGFFEQGIRALRPLTLRSIADAVGLHESTISRATAHKYLACERGVFELRYFFTPALASTEGERDVSTETVRRRIADLVATETADTVLSDDQIVRLLNAEGFDVARRTVAKYRDQLKLGSSVERRRRLMMAG
jgi:RNA polymerase sigma-54 factor